MRSPGVDKKLSGVTPHSLRHGVLLDLYEYLTGRAAAARGGELASQDPATDRAARVLVAEYAGHSRASVSSAYLGSSRVMRRVPDARPEEQPRAPEEGPEENS